MAKAILEYDLNDSDDIMAHERAVKSLDMALALWEFGYNTRKKLEWDIEQNGLDPYQVLDKVFEKFWGDLEERGISLDNIVN